MSPSRRALLHEQAERRLSAIRFGLLALAILVSMAITMMLPSRISEDAYGVEVALTIPLLACLYVVGRSLRVLLVLGSGVALASILRLISIVTGDAMVLTPELLLRALVVAATCGWVGREVLRQERVSTDTIIGGVCVYLMLGVLYADLYQAVEVNTVDAFLSGGAPLDPLAKGLGRLERFPTLIYFSFTSLTTMGFGDVTAVSPVARFLVVTEGMLGQLFPAVFIARLVGLHTSQARGTNRDS